MSYWLILIAVTAVVTMLILVSFGWRVFVAARELLREVSKATKIIADATEVLGAFGEMDGVKAMRTRTQHD